MNKLTAGIIPLLMAVGIVVGAIRFLRMRGE